MLFRSVSQSRYVQGVKLLETNNGTAIKETTHDEVEALKTMLPEAWDRLQIAAMVAIDNMVKQEARNENTKIRTKRNTDSDRPTKGGNYRNEGQKNNTK